MLIFLILNLEKIEWLLLNERSSLASRIMIWNSALMILKDNFIFGISPGLFQDYYLKYQKFFPPYLEWAVPYPHNIFLAFFIQAGILGILGFLGILAYLFKTSIKEKSKKITIPLSYFIYLSIHGLFDTPFWKNDLSLIFFTFLALFLAFKKKEKEKLLWL